MTRPIEPGCLVMFVRSPPQGPDITGMCGKVLDGKIDHWNVESPSAFNAFDRRFGVVVQRAPVIYDVPNNALRRIDDPDLPAEDTTSLDLCLPTEAPRVKA